MFTGFNLDLTQNLNPNLIKDILNYKEAGVKYLKSKKNYMQKSIKDYIINDVIDGTQLSNDWFPTELKANIFISHLHKDEVLILGLVGWLYENFGLDCFIDSYAWGYIEDLKKEIKKIYPYQNPDIISNHANVMLTLALQEIIDKTEVVMLVNTHSSISSDKDICNIVTYSPWLYMEIACTSIIKCTPLGMYRQATIDNLALYEQFPRFGLDNELKVSYTVPTNHLNKINIENLLKWKNNFDSCSSKLNSNDASDLPNILLEELKKHKALNELYKIIIPKKFRAQVTIEDKMIKQLWGKK